MIEGPAGTVSRAYFHYPRIALILSQIYAGLTFKISIHFPANYPYVPPSIKFDTPCFHPNVDIGGGAICLDILQVRTNRFHSTTTLTGSRTSGQLSTVYKLSCYRYSLFSEVRTNPHAGLSRLKSSIRTEQRLAAEF